MRSTSRGRRKVSWPGFVKATCLTIATGLLAAACQSGSGTAAAPSGPSVQATTAARLLATEQAAKKAFTISIKLVPDNFCDDLVTKYGGTPVSETIDGNTVSIPDFRVASTFGQNSNATALTLKQQSWRLWPDSVNSALPRDAKGHFTREAVEATACMGPDYTSMLIRGLLNANMGGVTASKANPWMTKGNPAPTQTVKWANHCMEGSFTVKVECAKVMRATAYMVSHFTSFGVHRLTTSWFYHLKTGLVVGGVPPIESVLGAYTGYFLVLAYNEKGTNACFLKYGINVGWHSPSGGDQRLAGFLCHQQTPAPVPSAPPTSVKTVPPSSPPVSRSPKPSPSPTKSTPVATPTASTPSSPPSTAPPSSPPPTTYSPPPPTRTPRPHPTPTHTGCDCTSTPSPSPSETCGCHSSPPASPSYTPSASPSESYTQSPPATDTPTSSYTPTETPSPQCTCMDTVQQVLAKASKLGFGNIYRYGAYPPADTRIGNSLAS